VVSSFQSLLSHRLDFAHHYYDGRGAQNVTVDGGGNLLRPAENDCDEHGGAFWCLAAARILRLPTGDDSAG